MKSYKTIMLFKNESSGLERWLEFSALATFVEDPDLVPSIYLVAHNQLTVHGIPCPLLAFVGTRNAHSAQAYRQVKDPLMK